MVGHHEPQVADLERVAAKDAHVDRQGEGTLLPLRLDREVENVSAGLERGRSRDHRHLGLGAGVHDHRRVERAELEGRSAGFAAHQAHPVARLRPPVGLVRPSRQADVDRLSRGVTIAESGGRDEALFDVAAIARAWDRGQDGRGLPQDSRLRGNESIVKRGVDEGDVELQAGKAVVPVLGRTLELQRQTARELRDAKRQADVRCNLARSVGEAGVGECDRGGRPVAHHHLAARRCPSVRATLDVAEFEVGQRHPSPVLEQALVDRCERSRIERAPVRADSLRHAGVGQSGEARERRVGRAKHR